MRIFLLPVVIGLAAMSPHAATAQNREFYDCQNDRIRIAIAPMRLDQAIARFTRITRCPVSIDTDRVKGRRTRDMKTAATKGNLTPREALASMLRTTPLRSEAIHGGFSVRR